MESEISATLWAHMAWKGLYVSLRPEGVVLALQHYLLR